MRRDEDGRTTQLELRLAEESGDEAKGHVVFDFTGLEEPDVCDLSLILTARLQSAATRDVWVRSLPWRTARILRVLGLDHLFRTYPSTVDELH